MFCVVDDFLWLRYLFVWFALVLGLVTRLGLICCAFDCCPDCCFAAVLFGFVCWFVVCVLDLFM